MSDRTPEPDDLRALGERLKTMRRREAVKNQRAGPHLHGDRLPVHDGMVSALVVGGGIGWGLDWLFGTKPIFLVVFFVLGAAAGIRNVMRAAKELNERRRPPAANVPPAPEEDDEER